MATSNLKKKTAGTVFGGPNHTPAPKPKPKGGGGDGTKSGTSGAQGYGFGFGGADKATGGGGGGLFSNVNEHQGANTLINAYGQGFRGARHQIGQGYKGLQKDYAAGINKIQNTAQRARADIAGGLDTATGQITDARDTALGYYQPYADASSGAAGLYAGALGLGGDAGHQAATDAFQTGPGYEWQMGQGLQALDRTAASRGNLAAGNTTIDTLNYSQGLANQEYQQWLNNLYGEQQFGAGIAGNMAGITGQAGSNLANLTTGAAGQTAANRTQAGTQTAAIKTGMGDQAYQYGTDIGNLGYASRLGAAGVQADFLKNKDQTGANIFGAVTGGLSMGAKLLGAS